MAEQPILHEILSVRETAEPDVYIARVDLTDSGGDRYEADYVSRPGDPFGLADDVRDAIAGWINEEKPVEKFTPPKAEDHRKSMPRLTPRQLRLQLVKGGFLLETIDQVLNNIPNKAQRDVAKIEWDFASEYRRDHPLIQQLATTLSLSPETVDQMWIEAAKL